jgi:hypothetical protein
MNAIDLRFSIQMLVVAFAAFIVETNDTFSVPHTDEAVFINLLTRQVNGI